MRLKMRRVALAGLLVVCAGACGSDPISPGGTLEGFANSDGTSIHYVIDLPAGEGPFPGVVYGPGSRDVPAGNRHAQPSSTPSIDDARMALFGASQAAPTRGHRFLGRGACLAGRHILQLLSRDRRLRDDRSVELVT